MICYNMWTVHRQALFRKCNLTLHMWSPFSVRNSRGVGKSVIVGSLWPISYLMELEARTCEFKSKNKQTWYFLRTYEGKIPLFWNNSAWKLLQTGNRLIPDWKHYKLKVTYLYRALGVVGKAIHAAACQVIQKYPLPYQTTEQRLFNSSSSLLLFFSPLFCVYGISYIQFSVVEWYITSFRYKALELSSVNGTSDAVRR